MNYIICKCGIRLNADEMDTNHCPVCEDVVIKEKRKSFITEKRREVWRLSQRKHRKKYKGLLT